jgi:hypothetical protein
MSERSLENALIDKLGHFLLELGKGFAFVGQQYRMTLDNTHYYVDLVFYHRILKCFVVIDLKSGKVNHQDIGQMNLYLNYFKREENMDDDKDPIGIILAADKDEIPESWDVLAVKELVQKDILYAPNDGNHGNIHPQNDDYKKEPEVFP